ncbi:protein D3-like [Dermacentor andersoni]|uniref:protein D3-like n=1 Tax=Dermacentor andersoni TaxID=34620 RepID=UPI003B3BA8CC
MCAALRAIGAAALVAKLVLLTPLAMAPPVAAQGAIGVTAPPEGNGGGGADADEDVLDGVVGSQRERALSAVDKAKAMRIIPDLIGYLPNDSLAVTYIGNAKVDMGNELEPTSVAEPPDVVLRGRSGYFYALCMVDVDAPSARAPKHRAWLHWLVVNIPAQRLDAGKVLATYSPPTPATSTGSHRFVFIQFEQPNYFRQGNFIFIPMRAAFNVGAFMTDNNIRRIVAFNFFRIETEYRNLL